MQAPADAKGPTLLGFSGEWPLPGSTRDNLRDRAKVVILAGAVAPGGIFQSASPDNQRVRPDLSPDVSADFYAAPGAAGRANSRRREISTRTVHWSRCSTPLYPIEVLGAARRETPLSGGCTAAMALRTRKWRAPAHRARRFTAGGSLRTLHTWRMRGARHVCRPKIHERHRSL